MSREKLLPRGEELKRLAEQLGVSTHPGAESSQWGTVLEPALQACVREALNYRTARRAVQLSIFAVCLSVVSTIVAIWAALK